jgi:cysteine-rich repeat protein
LELCDDGIRNGTPDSNCTITCQVKIIPSCGDGTVDSGEECDDGNVRDGDGCTSLCRHDVGYCGDGTTQTALNEECDEGSSNGLPQSDCDVRCKYVRLPECGDGTVNPETELCDEGSNNGNYAGALCRENCMLPRCGDGILDPNEECDDGNNLSGDSCDAFCQYEERAAPPPVGSVLPPPVRPYVPGQPQTLIDNLMHLLLL